MNKEEITKRMKELEDKYKYLVNLLSDCEESIKDLNSRIAKQNENRVSIRVEMMKVDSEYSDLEKQLSQNDSKESTSEGGCSDKGTKKCKDTK